MQGLLARGSSVCGGAEDGAEHRKKRGSMKLHVAESDVNADAEREKFGLEEMPREKKTAMS